MWGGCKRKEKGCQGGLPGAFMFSDMDEVIILKVEGESVDILVEIDIDKYKPYVVIEHGKKVIYFKLKKALYGTLRAALLFWQNLSNNLRNWSFEPNPYDPCVMNKEINGHQMTIIWHVDDLMVSHKDQDAIDNLIGHLRQAYQHPTMPLVVHEGLVHEYLGMTFDFSSPEEVKIGMRDYINSIIEEGPTSSRGHANTPAAINLFEINTNSPYLNKDAKDLFHHLVAKLLFLCKRVRPDIHTTVAFLTTKVKQPTEDDQSALDRVIKYLNKTRELDLVLRVHDIQIIKWFIDASFGVHQDYKS